jgi:GT2 family glycosyltransferase
LSLKNSERNKSCNNSGPPAVDPVLASRFFRKENILRPKVHIVLLNWNSWNDTAACLSSLEGLQYENWKVIVVDNGSTDDSASRIRERFGWAEVILTGKNLGFPRGCNVGIRRVLAESTDYVWLLNNDAIVDPRALDALVDKAESDSQIGAVGSAIYCMEEPTQLQAWGGGYVNFWIGRSRHFLKPVVDEKIQYIMGASLLIPRRALDAVGLLDEGIFLYWDDPDYCWRLRNAGWKLAVAGQSKIWHKGMSAWGRTNPRSDTFFNASAARFFTQYSPTPLLSLWVGTSLRIAKRLIEGDLKRAHAVWVGVTKGASEETTLGVDRKRSN